MIKATCQSSFKASSLTVAILLLSSQKGQCFTLSRNSPLTAASHVTSNVPYSSFQQPKNALFSASSDDNEPLIDSAASTSDTPTFPETAPSTPPQERRLDPLVQSLTQMDEETANGPTQSVPFFGEIPADGSILVLAPVALIAVIGFILTIQIAFSSKDVWVSAIDELNAQLSKPPVKETVVLNECRGLCSDQDAQLDGMRSFMQSLAPQKVEAEKAVTGFESVQQIEAPVIETQEVEVYGSD